jgi:hypothetical protein
MNPLPSPEGIVNLAALIGAAGFPRPAKDRSRGGAFRRPACAGTRERAAPLVVLIESAEGVACATEIAREGGGVALGFGGLDLAADSWLRARMGTAAGTSDSARCRGGSRRARAVRGALRRFQQY